MPNIRAMDIITATPLAIAGTDPFNSKAIAIVNDPVTFFPTAVTVDVVNVLEPTNSYDDHRVFVGTVDGSRYQVETVGSGANVTAMIAS